MRIKFIIFFLFVLTLFSCKKKDESSCGLPYFQVTADGNTADINIGNPDYGFYEIEYGPNGFTKGSGTKKTVSSNLSLTNLTLGTYDIYIRGNCGGTSYSEWAGPESFLIDGASSSCSQPSNLTASTSGSTNYYLSWYGSNDYYDIEVGETGFALGTGVRTRVNDEYVYSSATNFETGKTYDVYIRGNCGGSTYSSWVGPKSFYASLAGGTSTCSVPTNVTAYKSNSQEITYEFTGHSNGNYQISFSSYSTSYGNIIDVTNASGTYGFASVSNIHFFWARGKCGTGSYTNWVVTQIL